MKALKYDLKELVFFGGGRENSTCLSQAFNFGSQISPTKL